MTNVYTSLNHTITGSYLFQNGIFFNTSSPQIYITTDGTNLIFQDKNVPAVNLSDIGGGFENPATEDLYMGDYSVIFGPQISTIYSIYVPSGYQAYIDKLRT